MVSNVLAISIGSDNFWAVKTVAALNFMQVTYTVIFAQEGHDQFQVFHMIIISQGFRFN